MSGTKKRRIRIVRLRPSYQAKLSSIDQEVLTNEERPHMLVVKMKYKGIKLDFAIPLRSNINMSAPANSFYSLPNNSSTKPNHHHGLHFAKAVPITNQDYIPYVEDGSMNSEIIFSYIEAHRTDIINQMKEYLENYENGNRVDYCVDIDKCLDYLRILHPSQKKISSSGLEIETDSILP